LTPIPILKVLSTFQRHRVRALLIGGQACIVYGAVEFSRDTDFVVLVNASNMKRLRAALAELQAEPVFFPPLTAQHLRRGHACHFRCTATEVVGMRVDLMTKLRGCESFEQLWRRRLTIRLPDGGPVDVIGLRDLVACKKTQRDKDWFMLRRLVERDLAAHRDHPAGGQVLWWLHECCTPALLRELAASYPAIARRAVRARPLLSHALAGDEQALTKALLEEESTERERDRAYWKPLRAQLEVMRKGRQR